MPLKQNETNLKITREEINYLIGVLSEAILSPVGRSVWDKLWRAEGRLYTRSFRQTSKDKTTALDIPKQPMPVLE